MALSQDFFFFLCLDSLADAVDGGPPAFTKTLKAKQTDQCDNKRGMRRDGVGFVFV